MNATLSFQNKNISKATLKITGSKSESNRLLILQALFSKISLKNLSNSDDTQVLQKALETVFAEVDVHHAGTAMRFLTAFFAAKEGSEVVLTGSERMQQRPIKILVDALKQLGADIEYLKETGFAPLKIRGKILTANKVEIDADVSSQYISALMLIAPSLPNGLTIILKGTITSIPYIKMTLQLLQKVNIAANFLDNVISIPSYKSVDAQCITIESDWSSASYFYSIVALHNTLSVTLSNYFADSLQGDSALAVIYENLGVATIFNTEDNSITLSKNNSALPDSINLNLIKTPDIAQTIAVTCFGLKIECHLSGLHTLKVKETDRLEALKTEFEKLGALISVTDSSLHLNSSEKINREITINTYQDHRMAMAFAPLAFLVPLVINDAEVVSKSYPGFWEDLEKLGITISES